MPSVESNSPYSSNSTGSPSSLEQKTQGKTDNYRDVSPVNLENPMIRPDNSSQRTEKSIDPESITPVEARKILGEKARQRSTTPEQELTKLLSMDGELAAIYRTNIENHYFSESDRALNALMEHVNNGDLNHNLSEKKSLKNYKNLIRKLNLPKDLKISLTMDPEGTFCLIPVNNRLISIKNLKHVITTAINLTQKIKDTRIHYHQNHPKKETSRKKEILNEVNRLILMVNNQELFISKLDEIKKSPICITSDSGNLRPYDSNSQCVSEDKLIMTNVNEKNITPEQIEKLVDLLKKHRKKVQAFIHSTQQFLLENGPDMGLIESSWPEIEDSSLQLARQLVTSDSEHVSTALTEITGALEHDIAGLKRYIQDAAKYDFRNGRQYLKQIDLYEELVMRLSDQQSTEQKTAEKRTLGMAIINKKRAIAQIGPGMTAECVPETIKELTELDKQLRQLFNASTSIFDQSPSLYDRELIKILENKSESFSSRVHIYQHERWHEVILAYTPAAAMRLYDNSAPAVSKQGNRDPFRHSYEGKLAPSMHRDTQHAVNMLAYTMTVDGKETARHIRVGCPYAYREKGENTDRITDQRLDEIFTALLIHGHKQALKKAMKNPDHKPIELDCLYLNMLSPDHLRDGYVASMTGIDNEKQWVEKLHEKFMEVSGKERMLTIHYADGKYAAVKIRPQPVMFVSPCNKLALPDEQKPLVSKALLATANTWETVLKVNGAGLAQLLGEDHQYGGILGKKLSTLPMCERQKAKQLADELWALYHARGSLRQVAEQTDPFYFSGKLKELSEILGLDLFTGCKSNKDRTGISEAFHQAMLPFNAPHLAEQFMVYGGHIMIQMKNTGLPGYRLDGSLGSYLNNAVFSQLTRH